MSQSLIHLDRQMDEKVKMMNHHRRHRRLGCNEDHEFERMFLVLRNS
jgi:hypothetical protein